MKTSDIIKILEEQNLRAMQKIIYDLITDKEETDTLYKKLWAEYKGDVPIKNRVRPLSIPEYKAFNKISSGLRGLFVGQGVTYSIGKTSKVTSTDEATAEKANDFRSNNNMHAQDKELLTMGGVCGQSGRLLYIDINGELKSRTLKSWEYLVVENTVADVVQYGLIYYDAEEEQQDGSFKTYKHIELYDKANIYFFKAYSMEPAEIEFVKQQPHGFNEAPIIQYNNDKNQGDFYEERALIDSYDLLLSIEQDELEDLRTSYMIFKGVEPTPEQMENAKFTGAFGSEDPEFSVEYLEKQANAERTRLQLERVKKDAFTSASRIDFRDDKTNAQSGYARILELQALEDDCTLKKMEMQRVSSNMMRIASGYYAKLREKFDWKDTEVSYSSNLPTDLNYYADFIQKTYGKLPLEVIYSQLPFISDVNDAVEKFNEEASGSLVL